MMDCIDGSSSNFSISPRRFSLCLRQFSLCLRTDSLHELETQLTLVASRIESRVENGVDEELKQRFSHFEQKTEAIALRLAQIEGAISLLSQRSSTPQRRQSYQYHPPQLELQAYTGENLAKRLGIDAATLKRELHNQSSKDFERWCRSKDPGSVGWRFGDDGLFHPIKS